MSQVHDALKRANESDPKRSRQNDVQGRLKQPVASGPSFLSLLLWAVVVVALAAGGWFSWHWLKARHQTAPAPREDASIVSPPNPPPPPGVAEAEAPAAPSAETSDASAHPLNERAQASWPTELRLTGIIFSQTKPLALINEQPAAVGDVIQGIHVVKIEKDRVYVQWGGQTKMLELK